jgi:succinate dehydrogenase/fumarate reductase cytochrome b subunit
VLGAAGVNVAHVVHAIHELGPLVVLPLKAAVGFPLAYHASAGVRHLVRLVFKVTCVCIFIVLGSYWTRSREYCRG